MIRVLDRLTSRSPIRKFTGIYRMHTINRAMPRRPSINHERAFLFERRASFRRDLDRIERMGLGLTLPLLKRSILISKLGTRAV